MTRLLFIQRGPGVRFLQWRWNTLTEEFFSFHHFILKPYLVIILPCDSGAQSPSWEAMSHSGTQEISHLLWNLNTHYHVHKSLVMDLTLSQMSSSHFINVHFNAILPSVPRSSKRSLPFRFFCPKCCTHFWSLPQATCSAHIFLIHVIILVMFSKEYNLWSSLLCNFLQALFTPSP